MKSVSPSIHFPFKEEIGPVESLQLENGVVHFFEWMALSHSVKLTWHLENGELEDDPFLLGQKAC